MTSDPIEKRMIEQMTREELVSYLVSWGFQCYDTETIDELRTAALENLETESK